MKKHLFATFIVTTFTLISYADRITIQQGERDFRRVTSPRGEKQKELRYQSPQSVNFSPAMLSLATPLQLPPSDWDVSGLRINLIYGECVNFNGLDISTVGRTTGYANGIQLALLANIVDGSGMSLQAGTVNVVQGDYTGMQIGVANYAASLEGAEAQAWQIGVYNGADFIKGWQIGVINYAEAMVGLQIGLINIIANKDIAFMPIINAAF